MNQVRFKSKDFLALKRSGCRRGASAVLGGAAGKFRDTAAGILLALGVTPNMLTVAGLVLTAGAGVCLMMGAGQTAPWEAGKVSSASSWWPFLAALLLTVAGAADLLDGAVARVGNMATPVGALLDSTLDRFSDLFIFLGCAVHFSVAGNITYLGLSVGAAVSALLISYVKARAENLIDDCEVGY